MTDKTITTYGRSITDTSLDGIKEFTVAEINKMSEDVRARMPCKKHSYVGGGDSLGHEIRCRVCDKKAPLEEGDKCPHFGRQDCVGEDLCCGRMRWAKVENCSCHINPPCSACVDNHLECDDCGFTEDEEDAA
jgi:hypothetical protein